VTDDTVYANLVYSVTDSEDWNGILVSAAVPRFALCAFNRRSGKLRWIAHRGKKFKKFFAGKWHSIIAAPVVLGGRVYAEVKVRQMLVKSFLAAFDAKSGEMEWVTPLCSNGTELTMFHYDARGPLSSMLAAQQGPRPTVYCCTNLGTVFALDPQNGKVRWSSLYSQIPLRAAESYYARMRKILWANCPPVLSGGVLVVAPLDSMGVYAFEAETGKMLWKHNNNPASPRFTQLVGLVDGNVILAGTNLMALGLRSGKVKWASTRFGGLGKGGQGLVSSKEIVLPRPEGLYRFSAESGKVLFQETWPSRSMDDEPGNLLQAGDRLIVTGTSKVTVYEKKAGR
jgi:outer membrane protein assembly factor BamB